MKLILRKNPTKPLVTPPKIKENVTSPADNGGNKISTIFPELRNH